MSQLLDFRFSMISGKCDGPNCRVRTGNFGPRKRSSYNKRQSYTRVGSKWLGDVEHFPFMSATHQPISRWTDINTLTYLSLFAVMYICIYVYPRYHTKRHMMFIRCITFSRHSLQSFDVYDIKDYWWWRFIQICELENFIILKNDWVDTHEKWRNLWLFGWKNTPQV